MNLRLKILLFFLIAMLFLALSSCGNIIGFLTEYEKDVTKDQKKWGGYSHKQSYELIIPVFLEKEEDWKKKDVLVPPRNSEQLGLLLWDSPSSVEEYNKNPQKWPQVYGIVNDETRIRVVKFIEHGAWLWGSSIYIYAEILDGPFKGTIVDISDLSILVDTDKEPCPLKPDRRVLKMVTHQI